MTQSTRIIKKREKEQERLKEIYERRIAAESARKAARRIRPAGVRRAANKRTKKIRGGARPRPATATASNVVRTGSNVVRTGSNVVRTGSRAASNAAGLVHTSSRNSQVI